MKEIILVNGQKAIIRKAKKEDAKEIISYINKVGGESDFLTFGKNQFKVSIEVEEDYIDTSNTSENSIVIIVTVDDKIISVASLNSPIKERIKHCATLGISILKEYWGKGIGKEIIKYLIEFAKSNTITKRIELKVREDNERAINLYKKYNFEIEGLLKKDICVNEVYYNTIIMALYLD